MLARPASRPVLEKAARRPCRGPPGAPPGRLATGSTPSSCGRSRSCHVVAAFTHPSTVSSGRAAAASPPPTAVGTPGRRGPASGVNGSWCRAVAELVEAARRPRSRSEGRLPVVGIRCRCRAVSTRMSPAVPGDTSSCRATQHHLRQLQGLGGVAHPDRVVEVCLELEACRPPRARPRRSVADAPPRGVLVALSSTSRMARSTWRKGRGPGLLVPGLDPPTTLASRDPTGPAQPPCLRDVALQDVGVARP